MTRDKFKLAGEFSRRHKYTAVLRLRGLIYYMRVFFSTKARKKYYHILSYARLNCAVFNYFYMSLGQVRHTIVISRYQNHRNDNEIQL